MEYLIYYIKFGGLVILALIITLLLIGIIKSILDTIFKKGGK